MKFLIASAAAMLLFAGVSGKDAAGEITQYWYTDSQCTQGLNVVKVNQGQCYLDAYDYSGMKWECDNSGDVVGVAYNTGDTTCQQAPVGRRVFPPHQCIGPVFNDLYLVASGCPAGKSNKYDE